ATDRIASVFRLDTLEFAGGSADSFFPTYFAPWVGNFGADHGLENAVFVRGVAPGKAAFHARVAVIRFAVLIGHHANNFVAFQLYFERAAHAAIRTCCNDAAVGLALFHD